MKDLFSKYKNVILIVIIVIVVFFLYNTFFTVGDDEGTLLGTEGVSDEESVLVGREFLTTLLELRSLELDESIFSDRAFIILRDFSQEVSPQPSGRPNPFADIGNDPIPIEEVESPSPDTGVPVEDSVQ